MTFPAPSKRSPQPFNYPDAVRAFNDQNIQADLAQACEKLSNSIASPVSRIDNITIHLNRDPHGKCEPLRSRWNALQREFQQLPSQTRTNASFVSGRLKMFYTHVLPLVAREANAPSRRLIDEKVQVISSYMSISAENANMTRTFAGKTLQFCSSLNTFHAEAAKLASERMSDGHNELGTLTRKLSDLDSTVQQVCAANGKLVAPDVAYIVFSIFRIIASVLGRPGRSKVCHKRVSLGRETLAVGNLYEQLEQTYNQVAYAQYAFQSSPAKADAIVGETATLISDVLLTTESLINLFLAIWSRLQCDCTEILHWLRGKGDIGTAPPCVSVYLEQGKTIYAGIANALDILVAALEPSRLTRK